MRVTLENAVKILQYLLKIRASISSEEPCDFNKKQLCDIDNMIDEILNQIKTHLRGTV